MVRTAVELRAPQTAAAPWPAVLQLPAAWPLSDCALERLSRLNRPWRFETTAEGALLMNAPAGPDSSAQGLEIAVALTLWARSGGGGRVFESGAGFRLPDQAVRSPDAAWISSGRLAAADRSRIFWAVVPDFVLEVRSASDRLADQQAKMQLWIADGVRLGWLLDAQDETAWIYRPGRQPQCLARPARLSGEDVLPGLAVDLARIWP